MKRRSILLATSIVTVLLTPAVFAQQSDSGSLNQTGTVISQQSRDSFAMRIDRMQKTLNLPTAGSYGDLAVNTQTATTLQSAAAQYAEHIRAMRIECREQERRANRDNLAKVRNTCTRNQLNLESDHVRDMRTFMTTIPRTDGPARTLFDEAAKRLITAEEKIIAAIDAGTMFAEAQLKEIQQRLHAQFRAAYFSSFGDLLLQRERTWIALTLNHLDQIARMENLPHEVNAALEESVTCMEDLVHHATAQTYDLDGILTEHIPHCHKGLRRIVRTLKQWETASE